MHKAMKMADSLDMFAPELGMPLTHAICSRCIVSSWLAQWPITLGAERPVMDSLHDSMCCGVLGMHMPYV